ncbi:N-acetylmuramoyl-L-alanine amidase [Aquibacillus sediminis]|uniref:N-acetylmuramoyl-L-alanine amidase n=1 Tax=Aquibacillus sediminis TaxID=2574734 RepID=UPI001485C6FA|nr:N-acetylmuramoyl-L-alanine amidase [Aquibacillus sediminis]
MLRKYRKAVLICLMIISFSMVISTVVYAKEVFINVNNLNVRSGPGLDYDVIGQVHEDESYQALSEQGDWTEIQLENGPGWVTNEYTTFDETQEDTSSKDQEALEQTDTQTITVLYDDTNIRSGPSTSYDIVGSTNRGEIFDVIQLKDDWYEIQSEDQQAFIAKWLVDPGSHQFTQIENNSLTNKKIIIDAGHGGVDAGAIGSSGNYEKHYTTVTAEKLASYLDMLGAEVIQTRPTDYYMSLSGRASVANAAVADAFISLHYNSTPEIPTASGVNTYYYAEHDQQLARNIQAELIKTTSARDRGTHQENYQVLRENRRPAVLIELGFISNETEENHIQSTVYQQKLAKGIISGLNKYFRE